MRDLSQPVKVRLGDECLSLQLHATALADFEDATGMTVFGFVQPIIPKIASLQQQAGQDAGEEVDANEEGWRMLRELLAVETLSMRNILALTWALAGGQDRPDTPREFGKRLNITSAQDLITPVMEAVQDGMPEADEDAPAPAPDDEDPTIRPE